MPIAASGAGRPSRLSWAQFGMLLKCCPLIVSMFGLLLTVILGHAGCPICPQAQPVTKTLDSSTVASHLIERSISSALRKCLLSHLSFTLYRQSTERLLQGGTGIVFGLEYVFKHTARGIPTHKRERGGVAGVHALGFGLAISSRSQRRPFCRSLSVIKSWEWGTSLCLSRSSSEITREASPSRALRTKLFLYDHQGKYREFSRFRPPWGRIGTK